MSLSRPHTTALFDKHVNAVILGLSVPAVCLDFFVLAASGYLAWNPVSRPHLNRVSFRLLIYALIASLTFGISFAGGTLIRSPGPRCGFVSFVLHLSLLFSAGMFFCMALNLQLVLVHGVNGRRMEKYYVLGVSLMSIMFNIAPLAAGQFGWNATHEICSYTHEDVILPWMVATQSVPLLLMAASEVIAFLVIVGFIISYELDSRRYRLNSTSLSHETMGDDFYVPRPKSPISLYRNVILRIGLYPCLSCILNISSTFFDIYQVRATVVTELDWRFGVADLAVFSSRSLLYTVLATTDPAFLHALRSLRRASHSTDPGPRGHSFVVARPRAKTTTTALSGELETTSTAYKEQQYSTGEARRADAETGSVTVQSSSQATAIDIACQI
ncbi:hypothetical protein B0H16DRAFT_1764269 [Mycena metata]|uniref:Uncharacterized protein n=1 Tax=Mycena metata TaxID=1033252 RepID=A0AAD7I7U2_9AGAR|nr:hypothetical protein B0H16DRAFT_1764269 [Mycena metata]